MDGIYGRPFGRREPKKHDDVCLICGGDIPAGSKHYDCSREWAVDSVWLAIGRIGTNKQLYDAYLTPEILANELLRQQGGK